MSKHAGGAGGKIGWTTVCPPPDDPLLLPLEPPPVHGTVWHACGFAPVVTQLLLFCTHPAGQQTCAATSDAKPHVNARASA
jgi:hypothetical protein